MKTTIEAKISPRGLKYVASYFDNSTASILRELLQNCRRANASRIDITCDEEPCSGLRVVISDDGTGIKDPQDLLTLFDSKWDEKTLLTETPAGMGFFSLAHIESGVHVSSNYWSTVIAPNVFTGEETAEVKPTLTRVYGTRLAFYMDEAADDFIKALKKECEFFPVPVFLNKIEIERRDFLADAEYVFDGLGQFRIGIIPDINTVSSRRERCINFFGVLVDAPEYISLPRSGYYVRLDVKCSSVLDLELPARKNLVQNDKWELMKTKIRKAAYLSIESAGGVHYLRHEYWVEAKTLGVDLPEAKPNLAYAHPNHLHQDVEWDEFGGDPGICEAVTPDMLLCELDDPDLTALYINRCKCGDLLVENNHMEGYSWYPTRKITRLTQEIITKDSKSFLGTAVDFHKWFKSFGLPSVGDLGLSHTSEIKPMEINLCVEIATRGEKGKKATKYPANIAFTYDINGYSGIKGGWVAVDATKVGAETLTGLFFVGAEYDDVGHETDLFECACNIELDLRRNGQESAVRFALQQTIDNSQIHHLMKKMGANKITLELDDDKIRIIA